MCNSEFSIVNRRFYDQGKALLVTYLRGLSKLTKMEHSDLLFAVPLQRRAMLNHSEPEYVLTNSVL